MRNFTLALAACATFCVSGVAVEAMPINGVPGAGTPTAHVEQAAVIVRSTTVVRRPARRVCTTRVGAMGRRVIVCR